MPDITQKVLVSGASGLIGAHLVRALTEKRIQTFQLLRKKPAELLPGQIFWDPKSDQPVACPEQLEGLDAAIHLSGANLSSHRWTESYKAEIADSRVATTRALTRVFEHLKQPPRKFLCASATGIYGNRAGEILTETSAPGQGFLADTCIAWEAAADTTKASGVRVAHLRFGVVLSKEGGALRQMLPLFRLGAGGRLGDGRQWMSWIALPDLMSAILHILQSDSLDGPVNLVAPQPVTNAEFTKALGHALHRPAILPAPAFALRLAFGAMADDALLASTRAVPQRLLNSGFRFAAPDISTALRAVL